MKKKNLFEHGDFHKLSFMYVSSQENVTEFCGMRDPEVSPSSKPDFAISKIYLSLTPTKQKRIKIRESNINL